MLSYFNFVFNDVDDYIVYWLYIVLSIWNGIKSDEGFIVVTSVHFHSFMTYQERGNISSESSSTSEANASEILENLEENYYLFGIKSG